MLLLLLPLLVLFIQPSANPAGVGGEREPLPMVTTRKRHIFNKRQMEKKKCLSSKKVLCCEMCLYKAFHSLLFPF